MDDRFGDRERYGGGRRSPRGGARGNRQRYDMESNRPYRGTRLDGIDDPYDQEAYVSESGDDTDYRRIKRVRRSSIELSQAIQQSNNKDFAHDGDYFEVETGYEQFLVPDEVKHSPSSPAVGQVLYYMNGKDCTLFKQDRATFSPEAVAALIAEGNAKTTCAALKTMQDAGLKFETVDDAVIALRVQRIADSEEVLHLQMYLKADTCHLFDQALWKPDLSFRSCQKFHDQVGIGHLTLHYVRLFNARKEKFKDLASLSAAVKREHEAEQQELRQSKAELQALFDEKMDVLFTKKVKITEAQYHKLAKTDRQIVLEVIEQLETQGERVESFDELSFLIVDRTIQAMDEKLEQYASSMNEREQQVLKVALTVHPFIAEIQHDLLQFNPFLRQMGSFAHIFNPWMVDLEAELDAMIPLVKIPTQISEFESQRFLSLFQPFVLKLQPFLTHFQPLLRNMNPFLSKCTEFVNLITPMLVLLPSLVTHSFKSIHHELHTRKKDLDQKLDAQLDAAGEMDDVILRKIHELPQILDELESLERNACETGIPTLNPVAAAAAATGSAGVFPGVLSPAPTADEIEQMNEIIKDMSSPSFHHMREELVDFLKRLRRMITPLERFVAQVSIFFEKIRSLLVRLQSFLPKILAMLDDLMRFMEPECAPGLEHLLPFVGPLRPFVSHLVPFVENILPFVHQSVPRAQALRHYRSYIQIVLMISSVLILKTGDEGKDVTKPLSFASAINNFGANTASSINKNAVNNNVTFSSGITVDTSLPAQKINNPPSALRRLPSMKGNVTFGADVNFDSGNSAGTSARPKLERFGSTGSEFDVSGLDLNFLSGLSESPGVGAENAFKQAVGELDKRGVDISMKTEVSSDSDSDSIAPLAAFGGEE